MFVSFIVSVIGVISTPVTCQSRIEALPLFDLLQF